jgi:hypothetical protein
MTVRQKQSADLFDWEAALTNFHKQRSDQFRNEATKYAKTLSELEITHYRESLAATFLPSDLRAGAFEFGFYDLGLVYRVDDAPIKHFAISPAATQALVAIYLSMPLPADYIMALQGNTMSGEQFEEMIFFQLIKHKGAAVSFKTTNLFGKSASPVTLRFSHYLVLALGHLTPGHGVGDWLIRGYPRYPRFDFIHGYTFFQVSISSFADHEKKESARISKAFEKSAEFGGKNQIEFYLDATIRSGHAASLDSDNQFIVTCNGDPVPEFKIVYLTAQGKPNHTAKVKEYPSLLYVSIDELKKILFGELLR